MCSGCWKWLSFSSSCAIVERCGREIEKNFLCFLGNHFKLVMHVQLILEMIGCCLHLLENSYMHTKPPIDSFKNEKRSKTFTIFFHVLPTRTRLCFIAIISYWCNCLLAIEILLIVLELDIVAISWESSNAIPMASVETFPFEYTKSKVWFHLTRAESQAAMMVCVPQGFDIGLCENPAQLMLWLT
jgi:hypothetical protein